MYASKACRLFGGGEHASVRVRELDEIHLRRVTRDVDQVVAREAVAVHVAAEHVAHFVVKFCGAGSRLPERRHRGRAEVEVRVRVRRLHEHAMTLRVGGGGRHLDCSGRERSGCWRPTRRPWTRDRWCCCPRRSCRRPGRRVRGRASWRGFPTGSTTEPTLWFSITSALVMTLGDVLLIRFAVQRGRLSTPVNADCAAGRLALM